MPLEHVDVPYSDAWWVRRLSKKMHTQELRRNGKRMTRTQWLDLLWSYQTGEPPLPNVAAKHKAATQEFLRMARANFATLAVEALLDRTRLVGVRTTRDPDADGDDFAHRMLTANGACVSDAMQFAYALGEGYLIAGKPDGNGVPVMTAEDPRQVVSAHNPARPDEIRAMLKVYRDDDAGEDVAHLYQPAGRDPVTGQEHLDRIRVAVRKGSAPLGFRFNTTAWGWDEDRSGDLPIQGFGVPGVRLRNPLGLGEFEKHLDLLNRINNMIADRLWTSKFQVFRQRALEDNGEGDELTDEAGNPVSDDELDDLFEADPGAMWRLPPGTKIWESQQTDLTPILTSVRDDIKEFAAVTRTPLHMFTPDAIAGAAEGATLAREGLLFKAEDRTGRFTSDVLRLFRMGFAFADKTDLAEGDLDAMWAPAERYSLAQRADAARAAKDTGVPQQSIYTDYWQVSPSTAKRYARERSTDLLFQPPGEPALPAPSLNGRS
ncbi:MAG: phage portal protein [Nocardioidaceae bacterium]